MSGKALVSRRKTRSWRPLLTAVLLVAFSLQSFLIQTHLHPLTLAPHDRSSLALSAPHQTKAPLDVDKCVLCQEFVHSGTYLTPAAVAVLPPSAQVSLLPLLVAPIAAAREVSHIWMGRAPPRA